MTDHENDPLYLALFGDPDDATASTPAYRAAEADITALRSQIRRLGDVLAISADPVPVPATDTPDGPDARPDPAAPPGADRGPGDAAGEAAEAGQADAAVGGRGPATRPVPLRPLPPPRRRRWQRYVLAVCVAGAVGLGGVGLGQLVATGGAGLNSTASDAGGDQKSAGRQETDREAASEAAPDASKHAPTALFACAESIALGTVTDVRGDRVTMDVDRWFKPAAGGSGLTFDGSRVKPGMRGLYAPGSRLLVIVSADPDEPVLSYGADSMPGVIRWVERHLPDAVGEPCRPPAD
ncbi:hypothetical protein [Streptomyces sp. NPDC060194]|uniref:hypothetical protein n=1 Tax=Streptomyces sp. NPDC060194 TaxID=3347069 RepID=UPI003666A865